MFKVSRKQTLASLKEALNAFDVDYTVNGYSVTFEQYPMITAHIVGIDVVRVDEVDSDNDLVSQTLMSVDALALAL